MEIGPLTEGLLSLLFSIFELVVGVIVAILFLLVLLAIGMATAMLLSNIPVIILLLLAVLVGIFLNTDFAIGLIVMWAIGLALEMIEVE